MSLSLSLAVVAYASCCDRKFVVIIFAVADTPTRVLSAAACGGAALFFFFFCGTKRGRPCIFVVRLAWPCFVLEDDGQTWPILSSKRVLSLPSPNRRTMGATDVDPCSALLHRSLFIPGGPIRTRNRSFSLSCRSVFRTRAMPATTTLAANGTRSAESSVTSVDRFREGSADRGSFDGVLDFAAEL